MKANRHARKERNDRAEVGIGTMIVFIAAVIVAAIAAAVLVNTAGNLQRKSQETGDETTQEVSGNLFVRDIVGEDDSSETSGQTNYIDQVYWYVSLAPGADAVDLNETVIRWKHANDHSSITVDTSTTTCSKSNQNSLSAGFCVENLEQQSGDKNKYVLSPGDLVKVWVGLDASSDEDIAPRNSTDVRFLPEVGSPVDAGFTAPPTFGGNTYRSLT